jgi:uncharacterized delta-60 repeat protein
LEDYPYGMAVDDSDNIYVTGISKSVNSDYDYATVKFNSSGVIQWVARYDGIGSGGDNPYAIAIDSDNNIYVTGQSLTDTNNLGFDILTVKYNSWGEQQWIRKFNGQRYLGSDIGTAITIDKSNDIYITGSCVDSIDEPKFCTIKYTSDGIQQWIAKFDGTENRDDIGYYIKVDLDGNVYVSGVSYDFRYYFDFATVKYNSNGIEQWSRKYDGSAHFEDRVWGMEVDNIGNVFVMGRSTEAGTGYDYTLIKYNSSGKQVWLSKYHNGFNDIPMDMKIDTEKNLYITGQSDGNGSNDDIATVKFDSSGKLKWAIRYNYSAQSEDEARALELDNLGNVYVTGRSNNYYLTIKYSQTITGINFPLSNTPSKFNLKQNYPNPFNPVTVIQYSIPENAKFVQLKVFDVLGNEVAELVNEKKNAGSYQVEFDGSNHASGIYFYRLEIDGKVIDTKRMILLK